MNESISARIRRIITGTANSIVSKIEGLAPEVILEQAIDEVDDALDEVRTEVGRITAQKHHVTKTMSRLNDEHTKLEDQMSVAISEGRKDLIESACGRQVDIEDQLPALENQLADLSQKEKQLNEAVAGLIAKRGEMEDELYAYEQEKKAMAANAAANGEAGVAGGSDALNKADKAEGAFNRTLQKATGVRRGSLRASHKDSAKLMELAELNRKARIEAKMKALEDASE